jgi:hypothetical protein
MCKSDIGEWLEARCEVSADVRERSGELYRDYLSYHGYATMAARSARSHKRFTRWLVKHCGCVPQNSGHRYIVGLRLKQTI